MSGAESSDGRAPDGRLLRLLSAVPGRRDDAVAVVNGLFGDSLEERESRLATPMTVRLGETVLPLDRDTLHDALATSASDVTPRICLLVHGLMSTESIWRFPSQTSTTYGTLLAADHDVTVLSLGYNTGRHISTNGRELARLLKLQQDVGDELGVIFGAAASKAIVEFQNLQNVLKGILQDIAQIALRETITKPLSDYVTGALKGFNLASLLGSAKGNAFGPGGVTPFASGGIVSSPTLFKFATGTGVMGESGPEAILPLKRGRGGKLGVSMQGGGVTINQNINVGSGVSRNEMVAAMVAARQSAVAEVYDAARRGRVMA